MSYFFGNISSGVCFVLFGIFLYIKSLQCHVSFLRKIMNNRIVISLEPLLKIIIGLIGLIWQAATSSDFTATQNSNQFRIFGIVVVVGLVELAHIWNLLKGNLWGLVSSAAITMYAAILQATQTTHNKESEQFQISYFAINITILMMYLLAISRALEYLFSLHNCVQNLSINDNKNIKKIDIDNADDSRVDIHLPAHRRFLRQCYLLMKHKQVNIIYSNWFIYYTIFPMLTAILVIIEGAWMIQLTTDLTNPHVPAGVTVMTICYSALMKNVAIVLATGASASIILNVIDKFVFRRNRRLEDVVVKTDRIEMESLDL